MEARYFLIKFANAFQPEELWKNSAEAFDITFDWSRILKGDTIVTSTWVIPDDWTRPQAASIHADLDKTILWVGSGNQGTLGQITNTIVTTGGRTYSAKILCHVRAEWSQ